MPRGVYPGQSSKDIWERQLRDIARAKNALHKVIDGLAVGNEVLITYNNCADRPGSKEIHMQLNVWQGKIIQITSNQVFVQETDKPWKRQGISFDDIYCNSISVQVI